MECHKKSWINFILEQWKTTGADDLIMKLYYTVVIGILDSKFKTIPWSSTRVSAMLKVHGLYYTIYYFHSCLCMRVA